MAIILKNDAQVGKYLITEELDRESFFVRYRVNCDDSSIGECELLQYRSPAPSVEWFNNFVNYQQRLKEIISNKSELREICSETVELFVGIEIGEKFHNGLFRVVRSSPTRLQEFLDLYELSSADRLKLAKSITAALDLMHKSGLVHVELTPSSIGIREDGSPVFLDLDWIRFVNESAPWDGFQGEIGFDGYIASEVAAGGIPSKASDIYALGRLLTELLTDKSISDTINVGSDDTTRGSVVLIDGLPDFDSTAVAAVLQACCDDDPANRPTLEKISTILASKSLESTGVLPPLSLPPRWLTHSLQTLAFWVAYQNEVYRHHLLPEGAIVAELTRLIDSTINSDFIVVREPLYKSILPKVDTSWTNNSRADLAIKKRDTTNATSSFETVIEIKRASGAKGIIDEDLIALSQLKRLNPHIRTFLVVVSQASLPARWVQSSGIASAETECLSITDATGSSLDVHYRVRRVTKASASFNSTSKASYCCLIEVL